MGAGGDRTPYWGRAKESWGDEVTSLFSHCVHTYLNSVHFMCKG